MIGRVVEDSSGNLVTLATTATYNAKALPLETTDSLGRKSRRTYAANAIDLATIEVFEGGVWKTVASYSNYLNHIPRTLIDASGVATTLTLNAEGQVTQSVVSKSGTSITTDYTYDAGNYLTAVAVDGTTQASYTYDAVGRVATETDVTGYTLTYTYDALDRVLTVTHPDNTTEELVYENLNVVGSKDRKDQWTTMTYTSLKQVQTVQDPKGQITAYEWCRCGDLRKLVDPKGQATLWKRDVQGRVEEKLLSDGRKFAYTYEPYSGRLATTTFPMDISSGNPTISYAYHLDGQLATVDYTDATMADLSYSYNDDLGRLTDLVDGEGTSTYNYHPISTSQNGAGRMASINGPWTHDTTAYDYDVLGRPSSRQILDDTSAVLHSETTTFDSLGRVSSTTNELGTNVLSYDGNSGRPLTAVSSLPGQGGTPFLTRSYGWQSAAQGSRLTSIQNRAGTATGAVLSDHSYGYSADGQITSWTRNLGGFTTNWEFDYDPAGQITEHIEKTAGGSIIKQWRWGYDRAGNRMSELEGGSMQTDNIGNANRLEQVGGGGRTLIEGTVDEPSNVEINGQSAQMRNLPGSDGQLFSKELNFGQGPQHLDIEATDGNGNVKRRSYSFTVGAIERTLEFDLNGNTTKEIVAGGSTRVYEWDALNRLTAIQSDETPTVGTWRSEFIYDGQSRRVRAIEKNWNDTTSQWDTSSDHRYLWCGTEICQKRDSTGATVVANYYDHGEQRLSGSNPGNYHFTRDHLGSVREVVKDNGTVSARYDYTAWGELTKLVGSVDVEWGFTGHHYHGKSGLHLAMYRAYDANLGRWLSEDPLGEAGGINLYGYVGNDPVNGWDPLGLCDLNMAPRDEYFPHRNLIGRLFGEKISTYDAAESTIPKNDPNFFNVAGHGGVLFVDDHEHRDEDGDPDILDAEKLAKKITDEDNWNQSKKTVLNVCNTGGDTSKISPNIAQQLADLLNTNVIAPGGGPVDDPGGLLFHPTSPPVTAPGVEWREFTPGGGGNFNVVPRPY